LQAKKLRHVSESFIEDPVRILRTARFAARYAHLGFTIANETLEFMREMALIGEVDALVPERVWQEFSAALATKNPEVFLQALRDCGALHILFPELDQLFGVPNPIEFHPEVDSGIHTLLVLQAACRLSDDPKVRFAALLHDLGKGLTPKREWPYHAGHEEKGVELIKALCKRYRIAKNYTDLAILVGKYHGVCHKALELKPDSLVKLLRDLDAFRKPKRFEQFLTACEADFHGRPGYENERYSQTNFLRSVFSVVNQVSAKPLVEQGLKSAELGLALYHAQVRALKDFLQ
jgi:tRNA nucleotidyltransferase (CCA-adding enzyme)